MRFFNSFILCMTVLAAVSQPPESNSLKQLRSQLNAAKGVKKVNLLTDMGREYYFADQADSARFYFNASLNESLKLSYDTGIAGGYANLGIISTEMQQYETATDMYFKALAIHEKLKNKKGAAIVLNNLSNLYTDQGEYEKGLEILQRSLRYIDPEKDLLDMATYYANVSRINNGSKNSGKVHALVDSGYYYIDRFLAPGNTITGSDSVRAALIRQYLVRNKVLALTEEKSFSEAVRQMHQLMLLHEQVGGAADKIESLSQLAFVFKQSGRYDSSIFYAEAALTMLKKDTMQDIFRDVYQTLAESNAALGRYEEAYKHFLLFKTFSDSIVNSENLRFVNNLQIRYDTRAKDQQIVQLNQQKHSQRVIIGLSFGITLLVLGGLLFMLRSNRLQKRVFLQKEELNKITLQKKITELEQKALSAQMNPHFIFNCLSSIQNYVLDRDPEKGNKFIIRFARLIRQTLERSDKPLISLDEEIQYLENYLSLEQLRYNNKFRYTLSCEPSVDRQQILLPGMMLQPYVENAIRHGIHHKEGDDGVITISFSRRENQLVCLVSDNGVGRKQSGIHRSEEPGNHRSMGMQITEERIQLLGQMLGQHIEVYVEDADDPLVGTGTNVRLQFPFINRV